MAKTVKEVLFPYEPLLIDLPSDKPLYAKLIESELGQIFAASNERALLFVQFTESRHFHDEIKNFIKLYGKKIILGDVSPLNLIELEIGSYFEGKLRKFDTPYDISAAGTDFQRQVWEHIKKIEYGQKISFTDLAKAIGKPGAAQAVAIACGRNPLALVIPSHRIHSINLTDERKNSCTARRDFLLELEEKYAKESIEPDENYDSD